MYTPTYMVSLDKAPHDPQIRLGIQGPPKVGKTWAALTFPNPVVLNLDRGLGAHVGRSDVFEVPFYNPTFADSIIKRAGTSNPPNRKDAILKWLGTEALKLAKEQTLIIDGSTGLESAHDTQYNLEPWITKQGKIDEWGLYKSKNQYFGDITDALKSLQCNVVYICHETVDRDKDGNLSGGVRPLLQGQAGDKLAGNFTDWFRAHAFEKPTTPEQIEKTMKFFLIDRATLSMWMSKSPNQTMYLWQTTSDNIAKCGTSSLVNAPKFIAADYKTFLSYRRKTA